MKDEGLLNGLTAVLLTMTAVLSVGCAGDDEQGVPMNVSSVTRSGAAIPIGTSITTFLTKSSGEKRQGSVTKVGSDSWISTLAVNPGDTYYIYGFSPSDVVSSASDAELTTDVGYGSGATLTLRNVGSVLDKDLCVITGIQDVTVDHKDDPPNIIEGQFRYLGKDIGMNYMNVLLSHLCSTISFTLKVNATYNAMRTIKLKKLQLKSKTAEKYDITVVLTANNSNTDPIESVTTSNAQGRQETATVYTNNIGLELTTTGNMEPIAGYFVFAPLIDLRVVSTYDIYDTKGNLIRENCTAENKIPTPLNITDYGQRKTVNLTVNPTYLYMLSEPDLDNPTIVVE